MTKENILDKAIKLYEETGQIPVFKTTQKHANMTIDKFVVPQNMTMQIINDFDLDKGIQSDAINKLVDRTPNWLDLSEEDQKNEIKATLTLETVANYLYHMDFITDKCDMYENGFDKDGNVVLDAFYVENGKTLAEINRLRKKKVKQKAKAEKIVSMKKAQEKNKRIEEYKNNDK